MAKGEIARFKQFLLLSLNNNVFKKPSAAETSESVYMSERVKNVYATELHFHQIDSTVTLNLVKIHEFHSDAKPFKIINIFAKYFNI